jgi:MFS superfamily sulfate permease-like transporter
MKGRFYRTARLHVLLKTLLQSVVIIPKAMEYAMIAGLPVQVGLYTALVPMAIYAVLGTSRRLSVSTTTTLAILTAAQLGQVVPTGDPAALLRASATLALPVGAALVSASLVRLGFVANFISEPVLVGFRAGIGLDCQPLMFGFHRHLTLHTVEDPGFNGRRLKIRVWSEG